MIRPTSDDVPRSVISTIEDEIAPSADEYIASLCRTAAQMLRHVAARNCDEVLALAADVADLRLVLTGAAPEIPEFEATIRAAVADQPAVASRRSPSSKPTRSDCANCCAGNRAPAPRTVLCARLREATSTANFAGSCRGNRTPTYRSSALTVPV